MKDAENTVGVGTLDFDEPSAPIDSGVRKAGTLTRIDVVALRAELDWLDELEHPWGPFPTYQHHLEYILSQYDAVSPQRGVRTSCAEGRKD